MARHKHTSPAVIRDVLRLVTAIAQRHGITTGNAQGLIRRFLAREQKHHFVQGWWRLLLDAQFQDRLGANERIRCGSERHLTHLIPQPGGLCHDCGCAIGEYHVFGCDAEECSRCGEQAFCCGCSDSPEEDPRATV